MVFKKKIFKKKILRKSNFKKRVLLSLKKSLYTLTGLWSPILCVITPKKIFKLKRFYVYRYYIRTLHSGNIFNITPPIRLVPGDNKINYNNDLQETYNNTSLCISILEKTQNLRCVISHNNVNMATFSVGLVLKFFKLVEFGKFIRRSSKGTKIFLNFIKVFLKKKNVFCTNTFYRLSGFNYNLILSKKLLTTLLSKHTNHKSLQKTYFVFTIKTPFTKLKQKRIKSLKKRLRKNTLCFFLKTVI